TTSVAPPGPLSLLFPTDASTNQPTTGLTLGWRSAEGALWYRFQLATDSTFASGIVKNDSTLTDTTRVVSGLQQNSLYFWRGQGRNDGGSGPFSPVWSFRTYQPLPGQVELISPAHQATVSSDSAVFQWFNPGGLTNRYWFEIGIDSTFGMFTNIDSLLTDTVKVFGPLMTGKTYYWRVRGGNLSEWGPFSLVRNFSVIITDVEEETQIPDRFTLSQNYPNPFNPSTQIQFGVPREGRILLEVYNLLGERVATLIDGHMSAGAYTVRYNASDLPSGIYYYRMTAAESVITRKMLLVK
ncbi:MAG: T9SS type A sorting domain-containing protein, partial [Bacteroidota bacterium]